MLNLILSLKLALFIGLGTVFWADGDPQNPNSNIACYHRQLDDKKDAVVAHRTLPCGTELLVCNARNGKCTRAKVADRGPYGKTRINDRFYYTSVIDLSKKVAKEIDLNGKEEVYVFILNIPPPKEKKASKTYVRTNS